ncbi:hypothetical protein [Pontibacillus yanchengensis]|uniref:Uncharacterized protein n=1 Tax=Pontibacillus yanchengensis Y32 TaxID=1385514 RepID=A0A0A2TIZ9_9BACI|nr:hypothetical protein [Pontibacillus yanchengensis]KGP74388.1 hypothetical protein N782_14995 [Pontibacillus yanchengensis Y32]
MAKKYEVELILNVDQQSDTRSIGHLEKGSKKDILKKYKRMMDNGEAYIIEDMVVNMGHVVRFRIVEEI